MNRCTNGTYLKWWAGIDIRDILTANSQIAGMIGGIENVYPIIAPEGTQGSFIIYHRIKYTREYGKMGLMDDTARIEVIAITDHYEEGLALAALIDSTLTGTHTNSDNYSLTSSLFDSEEGFEDNKYFQTLIFEVK